MFTVDWVFVLYALTSHIKNVPEVMPKKKCFTSIRLNWKLEIYFAAHQIRDREENVHIEPAYAAIHNQQKKSVNWIFLLS